jgi:hypothetical protein
MIVLLAIVLLARIGPLCEAAAIAAAPSAAMAGMDECNHQPNDPVKKTAPDTCAMGCAVLLVELPVRGSTSVPLQRSAWPIRDRMMVGLVSGPSPPPPRIA